MLFTVEADIMSKNRRETGARKLQPVAPHEKTDQNAALPEKPGTAGAAGPVGDRQPDRDPVRPDKR
jgi:hypothetical protein